MLAGADSHCLARSAEHRGATFC